MKEFIVLQQDTNAELTHLVKLYKRDKKAVRIIMMNNGPIHLLRKVMFKEANGDFSIVTYAQKWNISKRNVMYRSESRQSSIIVKGEKIYTTYVNRGKENLLKHAMWNELTTQELQLIVDRFPQFRFISEIDSKINYFASCSFSSMLKHKLFSLKDILRHNYKSSIVVAESLSKLGIDGKWWKIYRDYVKATKFPDKLSLHFNDLAHIARTMDRKIDIAWSEKRMKDTHDKWSKELNIIVMNASNRKMNVAEEFIQAGKLLGVEPISNTKELAQEGLSQSHCVGSYVFNVESGRSGIYHFKGYTLQLNKDAKGLSIGQFKGFRNAVVPSEITAMVMEKLQSVIINN